MLAKPLNSKPRALARGGGGSVCVEQKVVVEAVGVEPTSEKDSRKETTCVSGSVVFVREV